MTWGKDTASLFSINIYSCHNTYWEGYLFPDQESCYLYQNSISHVCVSLSGQFYSLIRIYPDLIVSCSTRIAKLSIDRSSSLIFFSNHFGYLGHLYLRIIYIYFYDVCLQRKPSEFWVDYGLETVNIYEIVFQFTIMIHIFPLSFLVLHNFCCFLNYFVLISISNYLLLACNWVLYTDLVSYLTKLTNSSFVFFFNLFRSFITFDVFCSFISYNTYASSLSCLISR